MADVSSTSLCAQQLDVLRQIARGASDDEIAASLAMTKEDLVSLVAAIIQELGVKSRAQAIVVVMRQGW